MLQEIAEALRAGGRFLVTSHVRLDGDALGSELAFALALRQMGKEAVVYNQDQTPQQYRFLPGSEDIVHVLPPIEGFDAVVVLDCSEVARVGEEEARISAAERLIVIDHHLSNGGEAGLSYVDARASSTAELVYRLLGILEIAPTPEMATNLYTAILTDTGGFRYSNTGKEALAIAGELVERGADPPWISENTYENNPPAKIRLLARTLDTLSFDHHGRVGSLVITQEHFRATGALPEHADGFVDIPRSVAGVEIAILFTEMAEGEVKVSFRSKKQVDVESVARMFGGGGHRNAAACRLKGDVESVRRRVVEALGEIP